MAVVNAVFEYFAAIVTALVNSALTLPLLGVLITAVLVLSFINNKEKN